MSGRFIILLFIGNQQIGFLESWHKDKRSITICNNKHFARYFTTDKACYTMIEKIVSSYPYITCKIEKTL